MYFQHISVFIATEISAMHRKRYLGRENKQKNMRHGHQTGPQPTGFCAVHSVQTLQHLDDCVVVFKISKILK